MFILLLTAVILQILTRHITVFHPTLIPIVQVGMLCLFLIPGLFQPKYLKLIAVLAIPTILSFVDVQVGFMSFADRTILMYGILLSLTLSYLVMIKPIPSTISHLTVITFLCIIIGIGLGIGNFLVFPNHFFFLGTDFPLKTISVLFLAGISEELWLRRLMYTQSAQDFGSAPAVLITALSAATLGLTGNVMVYWLTYVTHLLLTLLFSQTKSLRLAVITNISAKIAYYIFTLTISRTIISPF